MLGGLQERARQGDRTRRNPRIAHFSQGKPQSAGDQALVPGAPSGSAKIIMFLDDLIRSA